MGMRRRDLAIFAGLLFGNFAAGAARADEPAPDEQELADLSIEQLMEVKIETATKEPRLAREAPAIISVITREDIRAWGFASVAEALVLVPGLYCVDDYLTADCGVRGVSGGERGYSKVLKVMIDGQPVAFRADTTTFLGPELIPIELVERIEVVRGPVSALYGANAFFGAVNVITRQSHDETHLGARLRLGDELGTSFEAVYLGGDSWWSASVGVAGERSDYDGRTIPRSSPDYEVLEAADQLQSRDARRRPLVAFARLALHLGELELEAAARYSELDAVAEFLDFGRLTHDNRVALRSLDARLLARFVPTPRLVLLGSLAVADGRPSSHEQLSTGAEATFPRRRFGSLALDATLEGRVRLVGDDWLTVGVDWTGDDEKLIEIYSVDRATGMETRTSDAAGHETLTNFGAYGQAIVHPLDFLGLTGNLRYDRHSTYGDATHYRLGAVLSPSSRLAIKLIYGTSFKAPPALQLFSKPLVPGEVIGNPLLRPERARQAEVELLWRPTSDLVLAIGGFVGDVRDKVELVPVRANLQPINVARQEGWGFEAEARWSFGRHLLSNTLAFQDTQTVLRDPFLGDVAADSERYPGLVEQLRWRHRHPLWGAPAVAVRFVSERRASSFNVRENLQTPYSLEPYLVVDLAYLKTWGEHELSLRLDNLFDADTAEPGFGGIDLPSRGRHAWVIYRYGL